MKILYNVTIVMDQNIEKQWIEWMLSDHIPDMMATGKFVGHSLQKVIGSENETGVTYAVQYISPDSHTFDKYQQEDSERLQKLHQQKFDGKYGAFRTLMQIIDHS